MAEHTVNYLEPIEKGEYEFEEVNNCHLFYNDEIINEYMDLITQRSPGTVYAFNTSFYLALSDKGYLHVRHWTQNVDIFSKQKLFIPIHIENHWCLVCVCFPQKSIKSYDSMGRHTSHFDCLHLILNYLMLEFHDKKREDLCIKDWLLMKMGDCPQQLNTWDCGVFVCMYAEYLSKDDPLNFSQQHVEQFRRQMALKILQKKLKTSVPIRVLYYNDEVINEYMDLITERSPDTVYAFNAFFYNALSDKGYSHVSRWTKNVDLFSKQKLFIPIHIENHWCLVYVCFPEKFIKYYDSMGGRNFKCLQLILNYLRLEQCDKKEKDFYANGWLLESVRNCPQQLNTWDCGVFVCAYAEYLSRGARLNFSQQHMGQFRRKIALEIKNKKLCTINLT